MLELHQVCKTFNPGTVNEKAALNHLSLTLEEGDFVTVIGGNGAGKSTMLNAISGVWPVDEGKILIDGVDVTELSEHRRAVYLGRVFQDPMVGTAGNMTIEENLALAARRGEKRTLRWGIRKSEREQFKELLRALGLGLEDRLTAKVGLLSGGQRQALTLLMASLKKPKVLLLDEHTAALDPKTAAKVLELSDQIVKEHKLTTLMVTHNMKDAIAHGNRLIMLDAGRVILDIRGEDKKKLTVPDLLVRFTAVSGEEVESDQPAGTILQQDPNANDFVSGDNMTITVTVSSGQAEEIKMPDLEGQTLSQALGTLDDLNLGLEYDYNSRTSYHDTIPKDSVISTYPTEGTVLHEGQQIILEMSLGPEEPETVKVITLIGMPEEDALQAITDMGLNVGQVQRLPNSDQPEGYVWYQSIAADTDVEPGTSIDIFVSTGSESGSGGESGESSSKTISFQLPDAGGVVTVMVVDSQGNMVHSQEYDTNMNLTTEDIPVSGTGEETYTMFINGIPYDRQTVNFDS